MPDSLVFATHKGTPLRSKNLYNRDSDLVTTLNTYAHVIPDSQRRAVERMSEVLFSSSQVGGERKN
jgi:hypothetical protein